MKQMLRKLIMLAAMLCCLVAFGDTPGLTAQVGKYTYTFTLLDGLTAAITGCTPKPIGGLVIFNNLRAAGRLLRVGNCRVDNLVVVNLKGL